MARTAASARPLTDHEEIRRWAEARDAQPSCVRGTGDSEDVGMIRLDFPGYSGQQSLEPISWDEWFDKFDERNLALMVQEQTARGQQSNFNKLVSRDTAESSSRTRRSRGGRGRASSRSTSTSNSRSTRRGRTRRTASAQSGSSSRRTGSTRSRQSGTSRSSRSTSARGKASTRTTARAGKKRAARVQSIRSRSRSGRSSSHRRKAA